MKRSEIICLGIESTAEKLGVGIVSSQGKILSNVVLTHKPKEGIHPRETAQHHADNITKVIKEALDRAGCKLNEIGLAAFSRGPGLGPCLRVGAVAARAVAVREKIPIIGVNHCIAHLEIGRLAAKTKDPLLIYVSGGNTQIIAFRSGKYRVFGETIDIAVGNCLDQFARKLNIGFPGGPLIEKIAKEGKYIPLPYVVKGMDLSFSGLLTASVEAARSNKIEDVCFSLQETAFGMVCEVAERAMAYIEKDELLLGGGVGANQRLQEMLKIMCRERGAMFFAPPKELLGDNGAMVAWLGILMHRSGVSHSVEETTVKQRFRTDEVMVAWR